MLPLRDKLVAVTGAKSMVGRAVIKELLKHEAIVREISHDDFDLLYYDDAYTAVAGADYCVHCAGFNGNIDFNRLFPAKIYSHTAFMALNVLRACQKARVSKVISLLSSCAYPNKNILKESEFLDGTPHESVEAHGLAKRILFDFSRQLKKEFGFESVCVVFNTCYGPYDSFYEAKTKVVGGLINRIYNANKTGTLYIQCWGTGSPRREFIYVDDAARGLVEALQKYNNPQSPLNIGSGTDNTIKELADTICEVVGYTGDIIWDASKPDGQYQKLLDNTLMQTILPDMTFTPLKEGIKKTIQWYTDNV